MSGRRAGLLSAVAAALVLGAAAAAGAAERYAVVITGASGSEQYAAKYETWRAQVLDTLRRRFGYPDDHVRALAERADPGAGVLQATRENVERVFEELRTRLTRDDQLFVLLIGHGTSADGEHAKFNLVGPDLSEAEWAGLLKPIPGRLVFVDTTGASFPFLRALAGRGRVVLTATDASAQRFETIFPEYFLKAFDDEHADADRNGRVSIWEAFSYASSEVGQWFQQKGQLPTERPLLDDTGAGVGREAQNPGTDGAAARVTYLQPEPAVALPSDAALAELVKRQAALALAIDDLKARKDTIDADDYAAQLERLLLEFSRISAEIRAKS